MLLFLFQLTNGDHLHYYIYCVRVGILCMFLSRGAHTYRDQKSPPCRERDAAIKHALQKHDLLGHSAISSRKDMTVMPSTYQWAEWEAQTSLTVPYFYGTRTHWHCSSTGTWRRMMSPSVLKMFCSLKARTFWCNWIYNPNVFSPLLGH